MKRRQENTFILFNYIEEDEKDKKDGSSLKKKGWKGWVSGLGG